MRRQWMISLAVVSAALGVATHGAAAQPRPIASPVPSHQPKLTHALWLRLVRRAHTRHVAAGCRPPPAVFFTPPAPARPAAQTPATPPPRARDTLPIPPPPPAPTEIPP